MICPCGGQTAAWVSWPQVPLVNALDDAPRFDLTLRRCMACGTVQVMDPPPPAVLFPPSYPYASGAAFRPHAEQLARELMATGRGGWWLDVASNDGTFVRAAEAVRAEHHIHGGVIGLDAARPEAQVMGFFPAATQGWDAGRFSVITALNVLAHVPDPLAFAAEAARLLVAGGVFVVEVVELARMLAGARLDLLYHEHIWTWSRRGLTAVLEQAGFGVVQIDSHPAQGGVMRVWARKGYPSRAPTEPPVYKATLFDEALATWNLRVDAIRHAVSDGGRWAGYGAAAKGAMFAYHAKLGPQTLCYVVDETPDKQGHTTCYGVPIVAPEQLQIDPPDGVVILAWNYAPLIRQKLRAFGGKVMTV